MADERDLEAQSERRAFWRDRAEKAEQEAARLQRRVDELEKAQDRWFHALYDAVTGQLENELDGEGYDGNTDAVKALERVRAAVHEVRDERYTAGVR